MKTYLVRSKKNGLLYPFEDPLKLDLRIVKRRLAAFFEGRDNFSIIGRFSGAVEWLDVDGIVMRFTETNGGGR